MPRFAFISDLPPQVREVLDVSLQETWLASYTAAHILTGNEAEAYNTAWFKVFQTAFPGEIANTPPVMAPPMAQSAVSPYLGQLPQMQPVAASEQHMGYWVDLHKLKFDDSATGTWLQAMTVGEYNHPIHGKIKLTPQRIQQFAANVKAKVRGTDLDIDYDHKDKSGEAAGWIKDAEARSDGLWVFVEWTADALTKVKNKAYRYFSPEFVDKWTHPKTNQTFNDVLFGGALTNRPFLKDILPINMSEVIYSGGYMLTELRKLLGLPDDADENTVLNATRSKLGAQAGNDGQTPAATVTETAPAGSVAPNNQVPTTQPVAATVSASVPEDAKRLAENDPVVRSLVDKIAVLEGANRLSEVNIKLNEVQSGSKYAIAPAMLDELKAIAVEAPKALGDKVLDLFAKVAKTGIVELGERGATSGTEATSTATHTFNTKAETLAKAEQISLAEAMDRVSMSEPTLFAEYRRESYIRSEG